MHTPDERLRVDILTKDFGFLGPAVTGLEGPIQAARVIVTVGVDSRTHVVVRSSDSARPLPGDEVIARLFPSDVVSCVRAEGDGKTTLSCTSGDERTLLWAASAAATLKRSWGWDESPTIVVTFAAGPSFVVDPVFDGHEWSVARGASRVECDR
jgi:hypothetical protein